MTMIEKLRKENKMLKRIYRAALRIFQNPIAPIPKGEVMMTTKSYNALAELLGECRKYARRAK